MADAPPAAAAPKKKGLIGRLLLPLAILVVGAAAGVAGGVLAPHFLGAAAPAGTKAPVPEVAPLEYVEIDNSFTANLKDSGRFIQVRIAVSTQGGKPVVEAVGRHRVALIAAVLGILSDTNEAEVERRMAQGVDFISVNTDGALIGRAATGLLQRLRKA